MVSANIDPATTSSTPAAPDWVRRREEQRPAATNRNIHDIYWRKPDGWIVVGPSAIPGPDGRPITRQAETLIRKGWTPLIEYSFTDKVSTKTGQRETLDPSKDDGDRLGTPDRYYWLFKNGGAKLFTIEQIVAHHWHINPPFGLPLSAFPQLEEYEVPEAFWCPACAGVRPPKNSIEEVVTHLMVQHQQSLVQVRDLQRATNDFRDQPAGASGIAIRRKVQKHEEAMETAPVSPDQPKANLRICNNCGEAIKGRLADHTCG